MHFARLRGYTPPEEELSSSGFSHSQLRRFTPPTPAEESTMKSQIITRTLAAALALTFAGVAPMTMTSAFANDNTDSDQPVTDTWITTKVKAELATTEGVKSNDVSVKTVDGTVTLTGVLPTKLAVDKAVAAAESIKGVKKVDHSGLKSH
jgi:hyperosmotically inducible protein